MDVSIGIVSYNALDKLRDCLDSLAAQSTGYQVETILVDNASSEPIVETVKRDYPWVKLVPSAENLGFAGGTNLALRQATGRFYWLLNPDTALPTPDTLQRFVSLLDKSPETGLLGCRLQQPDGREQLVARGFPTVWAELCDLYHLPIPSYRGPLVNVTGACLLTRAEVWHEVGELAEEYFMYFEDVDWCRRARDLGHRAERSDEVTIVHHEGASYGDRALARRQQYYRGLVRYVAKFDGPLASFALRAGLVCTGLPKLLCSRAPERRELFRTQVELGWKGV